MARTRYYDPALEEWVYTDNIIGLPEVTAEDNGKILKVIDSNWGVGEENSQVPLNSDPNGPYIEV